MLTLPKGRPGKFVFYYNQQGAEMQGVMWSSGSTVGCTGLYPVGSGSTKEMSKAAVPNYKAHAVTYPWNTWFSRKRFKLIQGRHFHCTIGGMTINIRQAAKRYEIKVRIEQEWDGSTNTNVLVVTVKGD